MQQELPKISEIRFNAMNFLALREHSVKELKDKLSRKYAYAEQVEQAINELTEQNLQSDERFAQAFVSMRQRQGKGPVIIKMELRKKGVAAELIAHFVDDTDPLWLELARDVRTKKFKGAAVINQQERAKQMRFLHSRGFSSRHIQEAFTSVSADDY
ncbi:MAG: regulatory protein RecX [Pseudomonadota bacterium]|nr:regulatory protein RecX [Pseudomonadota bacterium]